MTQPNSPRRSFLKYAGVGGLAALAGCSGGGGNPTDASETGSGEGNGDGTTEQTTTDASEIQRGGKPVVGLSNEPRGFNPLVISDQAAFAIIDRFYPPPTARNPENPNQTAPFLFKDWSFDPESLTGEATVFEGFTWSDGEEFTAEDVAFTINYYKEKEGHRYKGNVQSIKDFGTSGDYTVEFSLSSETPAVFTPDTGVFAVPILPPQTWEGVDNFQEFDPVNENGEMVGLEGWQWRDSDPGNWYELEAVPDNVPDEVHPGPYVDALRFRVFGSMTSLTNALRNGEVDWTYASITPNRAFQLQDVDSVQVYNSQSRGYNYIAHNMRRVPLDDKPFRQSLGLAYPYNYLETSLRKGLTTPGDYVAAAVYDAWRPDDFNTPFDHGPYQTEDGQLDVQQMRDFLTSASGKHDYTFGSVESSQVTGDQEIRVNGQLLTEAHTDNDGNGGQGPLEIIITPPESSPISARAASRFVENLNQVGIPAETNPTAENTQTSVVWGQENFDMWDSGWIFMPKPHFYMNFYLVSEKADLNNETEELSLNPMGYTNADDIINKVHTTYDPEQQKEYAQQALARVYEDAPVTVTEYPNRLHATSNAFTGYVKVPGGISQAPWSFLNIHQAQN